MEGWRRKMPLPNNRMEFATQVQPCTGCKFELPAEAVSTVSASVISKGITYTTDKDVFYQVEKYDKGGRLVCKDTGVTLRKEISIGASALRSAVRSQIECLSNTSYEYDMRAICYALGHMVSCVWSGKTVPTAQSEVRFLASYATAVSETDIVFCMPQNVGREVSCMLSIAAKYCGVDRIYVAAMQGLTASVPTDNKQWRVALHSTIQFVLSDAASLGCYGEHAVAFSRGLTSHVTVRAHSDEGGWWRRAIRNASYPRPRGYLNTILGSYHMPHFGTRRTNEATFAKDSMSMLLTFMACIQDADPLANITQSTLLVNEVVATRDPSEDLTKVLTSDAARKPTAYPMLRVVMDTVEEHAVRIFNLTHADVDRDHHILSLPRDTFRDYLSNNTTDSHLGVENLLPYLFIENGAVLRHDASVKQAGPRAGRKTVLPYFPFSTVATGGDDRGSNARGVQNAEILFARIGGKAIREIGMYYVASSLWTGENSGMQGIDVMVGKAGPGDVSMARQHAVQTLDNIGWIRPHCPVPAPGECTFDDQGVLARIHRDKVGKVFLEAGPPTSLEVTLSVSGLRLNTAISNLTSMTHIVSKNMSDDYRLKMTDDEVSMEQEAVYEATAKLFHLNVDPRINLASNTFNTSSLQNMSVEQIASDPNDQGVRHTAADNEAQTSRAGGAVSKVPIATNQTVSTGAQAAAVNIIGASGAP
uniref:Capsid n=1 Tax=viral metagenome TaxID=1070528 RepID=A0A2V0RBE2_9ZZZZ